MNPDLFPSLPRHLHRYAFRVVIVGAILGASWFSSTVVAQQPAAKPRGKGSYSEVSRFTGHTGAVVALAISPDGRYIASAGADRAVHMIDGKSWKSTRKFVADANITDIVFTRTGELVIAGEKSPKYKACVYVWQSSSNKVIAAWNDASAVVAVAISPDGKLIAAVEADGRTRMMSRDHNTTALVEEPHPSYRRTSIGFSPDGKTITTGGINGFVHRWRLVLEPRRFGRGPREAFPPEFRSIVQASVYAPDNSCVGTAHDDGTARIYLEKAKLKHRMLGHTGGALTVAFSPDSKYLVSGGKDNSIKVWDVIVGDLLWDVTGHNGAVNRVLAPTADSIVSASADGSVRYWRRGGDVDSVVGEVLADAARARPTRKSSLPVPAASELTKSRDLIKDVFSADFTKATDDTGRRGLATKLLAQARQDDNLPAERYAALDLAAEMAIAAREVKLAIEISDEFAVWFEGDPLPRLVQTAQGLSKSCKSAAERTLLAKTALQLVDDATSVNKYVEAARILEVATTAALAARNSELQEAVKSVTTRVEAARSAWDAYQAALKTLAKDSTDATANLEAGRYLCFVRADWAKGIEHLSRGSDERLRDAAARELLEPQTAEEFETVGDLWQAAAENAIASDRGGCSASADYWYRKALDGAAGLRKVKIQQSLEKVGPVPQHLRRKD